MPLLMPLGFKTPGSSVLSPNRQRASPESLSAFRLLYQDDFRVDAYGTPAKFRVPATLSETKSLALSYPAVAAEGPCPAVPCRQYLSCPALLEARQRQGETFGFTGYTHGM